MRAKNKVALAVELSIYIDRVNINGKQTEAPIFPLYVYENVCKRRRAADLVVSGQAPSDRFIKVQCFLSVKYVLFILFL